MAEWHQETRIPRQVGEQLLLCLCLFLYMHPPLIAQRPCSRRARLSTCLQGSASPAIRPHSAEYVQRCSLHRVLS